MSDRGRAGAANPAAKITAEDVFAIRQAVLDGLSRRKVAARYDLSHTQVNRIMRGERWRSLQLELSAEGFDELERTLDARTDPDEAA